MVLNCQDKFLMLIKYRDLYQRPIYKTTDELPEMARNPGRVIPAGMVNLNYL